MKVGIITWHYFLNFGSALQAYALKISIEKCGHYARIINYRMPKHGVPNYYKDKARVAVSKLFYKRDSLLGRQITYPFLRFQSDYLKLGCASSEKEWLTNQFQKFDCIVCGSDQIWAPNVLDATYLLEEVPDSIRKVSYAASIGLNDIPERQVELYHNALMRFSYISVREEIGRKLLQKKCGIQSEVVLDPTMLVSIEQWRLVEREPTELHLKTNEKFCFCYFLKTDNKYKKSTKKYAKENHFHIIGYSLNKSDNEWMEDVTGKIGPREFLWLIHHSESVITDSFHGTVFSLLNHKPFATFLRFKNDEKICQNSRIFQLDNYFSIKNHFYSEEDSIDIPQMNFEIFEKQLNIYRLRSMEFLKTALGEEIC